MRNRQIIGVSTSEITKEETVTLILTDKQRQQVFDFSNLVKLSQGGGGEEGGGGEGPLSRVNILGSEHF